MKIDADKLLIAMSRNCMTQSTLAYKTGMSPSAISLYIKRKSGAPSGIGRIAKALDVDVTEILPDNQRAD